jgi:outer membrane protein TolC
VISHSNHITPIAVLSPTPQLLFVALLACFCLVNTPTLKAQTPLSYQEYLLRVTQNHPTAQRANLLNDLAAEQIRVAKGNFDPKLNSDWQAKRYNDKIYYSQFDAELKIPMYFGADLKIGYQLADGYNLNPADNLPLTGLAAVGISLPLLQGLKIDDRRAALQQARLLKDMNQNERYLTLNDLLFGAALAYWDWIEAYQHLQIAKEALRLSQLRLIDLKNTVLQGERPAIDTIEARLIVQERRLQLQETTMEYDLSKINLNNFLWQAQEQQSSNQANSDFLPIIADTSIIALPNPSNTSNDWATMIDSHPILTAYRYKSNSLDIERQLKANKLLPKLNIQYNFLAKQFNYFGNEGYGVPLLNNFKWGISASVPLLFRQERGNLALAELKLKDIDKQTQQKSREIGNKITAQTSKINNLVEQIRIYQQNVRDYQTLLDAENTRFAMGESSVFLVNSRETKLVEAKQKMISLQMKYYRARVELEWAKGKMPQQIE